MPQIKTSDLQHMVERLRQIEDKITDIMRTTLDAESFDEIPAASLRRASWLCADLAEFVDNRT